MLYGIRYRIDAHAYDRRKGGCRSGCPACALEARAYGTLEAAVSDQPAAELRRHDGDQGGLVAPERRFEVVVIDHTSGAPEGPEA